MKGKPRCVIGYRNAGSHESVLLGVFSDDGQTHEQFRSLFDSVERPFEGEVIDGVAGEHSRKPDGSSQSARRMPSGAIYSRARRAGFRRLGQSARQVRCRTGAAGRARARDRGRRPHHFLCSSIHHQSTENPCLTNPKVRAPCTRSG
jgi:hypothetical protein